MTSCEDDVLSELLIAQLLEEDLRLLGSVKEAERLQLDQVIAASVRSTGRIPKFSASVTVKEDADVALEIYAEDARLNSDAAYARRVQHSSIADRQYAQKVAAAEKKLMLDAEFARHLQAVDDEGRDTDKVKDAESLLGRDVVDKIMASDLNEKGKGKIETSVKLEHFDQNTARRHGGHPTAICKMRICMDPFQSTHSPYAASLSANSSSRLQFGLRLPCPQQHAYCVGCLGSYITGKLEGASAGVAVFPIRCPECPVADFIDGIPDDVAERTLGKEKMVLWDHQKLLLSIPHIYCPNPKCSAIVQTSEDTEDPQAVCPSCELLICVACRVAWHHGLSCEQYQALPPDERSPEDRLLLELAKAKHWRRCPNCSSLVELVSGCNHISCRCGTHFCFKCGCWSLTTTKGACLRDPPCSLWDEEMLLEERERDRAREADRNPPPYNAAPPPPPPHEHVHGFNLPGPARRASLNWMDDPAVVCSRHYFTTDMIRNLVCGYCNVRLNSLADLRFHLLHVRRHPVYSCCGRFFRRVEDYERHTNTYLCGEVWGTARTSDEERLKVGYFSWKAATMMEAN
ncbi:hypothetical protein B0H17DRAFT_1271880 [Mycena rosella]|uniref:RBR-type E3 ubiquitin transferase n=1 Tax=Mycena rosella TaxID=1033263 RepID=A0AAD7DMN1_MYCRO|nr:hypothetical protein B0H17DRAFT_1271880 [Mycena rosella]